MAASPTIPIELTAVNVGIARDITRSGPRLERCTLTYTTRYLITSDAALATTIAKKATFRILPTSSENSPPRETSSRPSNLTLRGSVQELYRSAHSSDPIHEPGALDHAECTAPTGQHELDHTDHTVHTVHTDHTDHTYIRE